MTYPLYIFHNNSVNENDHYLVNPRPPVLTTVCQASRLLVLNKWYEGLSMANYFRKSKYNFYDPGIDTVLLDLSCWGCPTGGPTTYCRLKIGSVGIPFEQREERSPGST
jgi:hypothetical protein